MANNTFIDEKEKFIELSTHFFESVFDTALNNAMGEINVRIFPKNQYPENYFFNNTIEASNKAYDLCNAGIDVYFGVNPRIGKGGKKENVHYVTGFHAEIDYGKDGHKKQSVHETYDDALESIKNYQMKPTLVNHSGGGFHAYWILNKPDKVANVGLEDIELINKSLLSELGGDSGTHDISRVLRVPGTYNFKLANNPQNRAHNIYRYI